MILSKVYYANVWPILGCNNEFYDNFNGLKKFTRLFVVCVIQIDFKRLEGNLIDIKNCVVLIIDFEKYFGRVKQ